MDTVLAGARVRESTFRAAKRILQAENMSVSQAIQNLMAVTAATGSVPECIRPKSDSSAKRAQLDALMDRLESRPRKAWEEGKSDKDLLGEERERRFG